MSDQKIRVAVAGAAGRMGREVVRAVHEAGDMVVAAAVDVSHAGQDAGDVAGVGSIGVPLRRDLEAALRDSGADVLVDFTVPDSAAANVEIALRAGAAPVVGTTGFSAAEIDRLSRLSAELGMPALIAPNFAIGAVLMMEFAAQAARHMPDAEIIELHHENKLDAPSGTAMLTARKIAAGRQRAPKGEPAGAVEKVAGARGGTSEEVHVHSVRLPGFVAHQEVIFGGLGQTLTIRHDSTDRRSFMPGVLLAVRRVRSLTGLTVGLEHLLNLGG